MRPSLRVRRTLLTRGSFVTKSFKAAIALSLSSFGSSTLPDQSVLSTAMTPLGAIRSMHFL